MIWKTEPAINRPNYHYADCVYRKSKLGYAMANDSFGRKNIEIADAFRKKNIPCQFLFLSARFKAYLRKDQMFLYDSLVV
jgi:hypothetical protein